MATLSVTELQDCSAICKTFERGCHYSISEESVYAVLAPQICTMRNLAQSTTLILDNVKKTNVNDTINNPTNETVNNDDNARLKRKSLADQWTGDQLFNVLGSDCIPCKFKTYSLKQLNLKNILSDAESALFGPLVSFFQQALQQLQAMLDMLSGKNQYIDLCQFIKFFKEFMCVPDIQFLIAALTALLAKLALELSGLFDLIIQLIGPIMLPFLNIVINQLQQLIELAIKPLECIVNAITELISKLDIGALFKNLGSINTNIGIVGGTTRLSNGRTVTIPNASVNVNLSGLKDLGQQLDYASSIKQASQNGLLTVRSMLFQLVDFCRETVDAINNIQALLVGDFLKLLNSLTGGGNGTLFQLNKKLAIVQVITILKTLIQTYKKGTKCSSDEEEALSILPLLPLQNASIYKNDQGQITFQQNPDVINNTINQALASLIPNDSQPINSDTFGNNVVQNLQSLIELTGDKVLDSEISKTIDAISTPTKITFDCTTRTSVSDAEKVNQWIAELS